MIKTFINKNNLIVVAIVLAVFSASHSASADSYISHTCDDLGIVTATVNISQNSFTTVAPMTFTASGYITSFCGPRNMKLTAQNNNGTIVTLIPETYINPGRYPEVGTKQAAFQSPALSGIYDVHFELGVNEPDAQVDLCPDATNPNPLFQGVQTTLPPGGFIASDGKCKIKVSADVTYQCTSGKVKYTMAFDRPVPADMMVYVAYLMNGPFNNPKADHLAFTSQYYNFQFEPVTTNNTDGYGTYINLTKGMTSHTTPYPKLSNGAQENPYQSSSNVQECLDAGSLAYARTSAVYFKVSPNSSDIYVTDFRLKNYTGPVSGFHYANQ